MKMWVIHGLIAAAPFYLVSGAVWADEPGCTGNAKVVWVGKDGTTHKVDCSKDGEVDANVFIQSFGDGDLQWVTAADGEDGNHFVFVQDPEAGENEFFDGGDLHGIIVGGDGGHDVRFFGDGDGAGVAYAMALGAGDGDGDEPDHKFRVFARQSGENKGAFLGVNLSSSSDGDGGSSEVLISGLVEGGPAEKAGLAEGDVILSIGGDSVESNLGALMKTLSDRKPGDEVEVVVLRDGEELSFDVTLGSRTGIARSLAFGPGGVGEVEDQVRARGHIMLKNDEGDWEVKDLGDIEAIKDLPQNIRMFMPKLGSRSVTISTDNGERVVSINRIADGETLKIEERDGEITVTRVDEEGEEIVDVYPNEDELKAVDAEAYELLQQSTGNVAEIRFGDDGDGVFDFHIDLDSDAIHEDIAQWRGELDDTLGQAREAYERAMEEMRDLHKGFDEEHAAEAGKLYNMFKLRDGDFKFPGVARFEALGKPRHSFEVRSDGTIEVKIRKGDSELVQLFDSEDDMATREPGLFEKYRSMMDEND